MDYSIELKSWYAELDHIGRKDELKGRHDGDWSIREILGHLLDSATINRFRIKAVCLLSKPEFTGYNQREFVHRNNYESMAYVEILKLWYQMNTSLFNLVAALTESELNKVLPKELFNTISFKLPNDESEQNLKFVIADYADHLEHHLQQMQKL